MDLAMIIIALLALIVLKIIYELMSPRDLQSKEIIEWERRGEYIHCYGFNVFCIMEGEFKTPEKTLVLLHGYPESSFVYKDCIEEFKKHFNCIIAMDFVGFGLSEKPSEKRRD